MLRERTFALGGGGVIALGLLLGFGLWWAGAGAEFWAAWLAAGISVGLGAFFLKVGAEARTYRRRWQADLEAGRDPPPGGPPG